jgi:5-methylcytosine-specific restriction endonuclease McrA
VTAAGTYNPPWSGRRAKDALIKVKALGRSRKTECCICKQGIDYSLEYPHPQSCSVQHVKSRKVYPHLTWEPSNWEPAHLDCNKAAGTKEPGGMGITSEDW